MFFEGERKNFFRPLSGVHREVVLDAILTAYAALFGPDADLARPLTRDDLKELLFPVAQRHKVVELEGDESAALTPSELIRALVQDGWIERVADASGVLLVYRFTRAGKLVAEALWSVGRTRERVRQRNVRGCRNALEAALKSNDALDLIDAHDYAERILGDLAEGVDYFQGLMRNLVSEASQAPWDEFVEFLERFERDFKQQLTADNVERHRLAIRDALSGLHAKDLATRQAMDARLHEVAPRGWRASRAAQGHLLGWVLSRIEELVESACESKYPELLRSMGMYMRRTAAIAQQAYILRSRGPKSGLHAALKLLSESDPAGQDALLERIGQELASVEIRLVDPASVRLRTIRARARAAVVVSEPVTASDARRMARVHQAEAAAFSVSNDTVRERLIQVLDESPDRAVSLAQLPATSVSDILTLLHAVEAARSAEDASMRVAQLDGRYENPFISGTNYLIEKVR